MIHDFSRSLADLLGEDYVAAVCRARAALTGEAEEDLLKIAHEEVEFYPAAYAARQEYLMTKLGEPLCPPAPESVRRTLGAPTDGYRAAQHPAAAPLSGCGCFRLGEDGRVYFAGKSEHYHIPLGHGFPGYRLIEKAKLLGIPNATHNNTRGYVTRLLEEKLISAASGVERGTPEWEELLQKREPGVLNRVINLETGSLVAEAALKMMLARFYTMGGKKAQYEGRIPVFLVMADNDGGITAGYHGTTILAQTLRGIWPELLKKSENAYRVVPVKINDAESIRAALETWNRPPFKTAGFCHEIIMMNYSGVVLTKEYLTEAYRLCRANDTPVLCDEIQSGAWYDTCFLFRRYGIRPDFVAIGKGFPGGQYPASRVLASGAYDTLEQFGALVTNGQEELASLAYLVTMEFLQENGEHVRETGRYYHESVAALAARHPGLCAGAKGDGHMTALLFQDVGEVSGFVKRMNGEHYVDLSAQTYKANCLPVALTKLPLIVTEPMVDLLVGHMEQCLREMEA